LSHGNHPGASPGRPLQKERIGWRSTHLTGLRDVRREMIAGKDSERLRPSKIDSAPCRRRRLSD